MDYYLPAYIGLVISSIGVLSLPAHLTNYRERGVLKRLRATSISIWSIFGSQLIVSFIIAILGAILMSIVALLIYDAHLPEEPGLLILGFILSVLGFSALGVLLGALLPTTRAAQGLGIILYFVMLMLAGAGPPREVMTAVMQNIGDITPLRYVILMLQDPWLGFGWNVKSSIVVSGILIAASLISIRFFKWD
jgi:ABC-2 type transport system permease protein